MPDLAKTLRNALAATVATLSVGHVAPAFAAELLLAGDFESGTTEAWIRRGTRVGAGASEFVIVANGGDGPRGRPVSANPLGGKFEAVFISGLAGAASMQQRFETPGGELTLAFDWFAADHGEPFGQTDDLLNGLVQNMRVDILPGFASGFSVSNRAVVLNLLNHAATHADIRETVPWQTYTFRFTLDPGVYQLRFGASVVFADQEFGFDNVSLTTTGVPEASTWALMLLGFGGLGAVLRRREAASV